MAISYNVVDVKLPWIKRRNTSRWIKSIISLHRKRVGDIAYIFCSDSEILRINNLYLDHDYYTDIITFDYSEEEVLSGDLFISLDTIKSNSEKFGTSYDEELNRVIIHGILHLCGFKDKTKRDEAIMRTKEDEALIVLKQIESAEKGN